MSDRTQTAPSLLIEKLDWQTDFYDAYGSTFESAYPVLLPSAVKEFFFSMPPAVLRALWFREKVAGFIGLKTASGSAGVLKEIAAFNGNIGEKIALMEVWDKSEIEILTGQLDKHLDFALSFYLNKQNNHYELKLTTAVRIHNQLGKIYFALVKPVHKLIMPQILKRQQERLVKTAAQSQIY
jgi:hypothetical protein